MKSTVCEILNDLWTISNDIADIMQSKINKFGKSRKNKKEKNQMLVAVVGTYSLLTICDYLAYKLCKVNDDAYNDIEDALTPVNVARATTLRFFERGKYNTAKEIIETASCIRGAALHLRSIVEEAMDKWC